MIRDRQARQERAQAAAKSEQEALAAHKRMQSEKLRKLRLQKEAADASNFKNWREQNSLTKCD